MYEELKEALKTRNMTVLELSRLSDIASQDLYQALGGKRPFYPKWRRAVSQTLDIPRHVLFPEDMTNMEHIVNLGGFVQIEEDASDETTVIRFDSKWLNRTYEGR